MPTITIKHHRTGQEYQVDMADSVVRHVFAVIRRKPVSALGNYQQDVVLRTIKPGSRNYIDAAKAAHKVLTT